MVHRPNPEADRKSFNKMYIMLAYLAGCLRRFKIADYATKIALVLLLLPFLYFPISFLYNAITLMSYPRGIDSFDGFHMLQAHRLYTGENSYYHYQSIGESYPPVYYIVTAVLIPFFGKTFSNGRLVSAISTLLVGCFIYLFVRNETKSRRAAFLAFSMFYSISSIIHGGLAYRPDMLGIFFSLMGFYLVLNYDKRRYLACSILFFLLAVYTKQTLFSAPVASFVYLFFKDRKKAFYFGMFFILLVAAIFCILNLVTSGQFYVSTLEPQKGFYAYYPDFNRWVLGHYLGGHYMLLAFAFSYALFKAKNPFSIYLLFSLLSFFIAGDIGSYLSSYYFIENLAIVCILMGFKLKDLFAHDSTYVLGVLILLCSAYFVQNYSSSIAPDGAMFSLVYDSYGGYAWVADTLVVRGPFYGLNDSLINLSSGGLKPFDAQEPDSSMVCSKNIYRSIDFQKLFSPEIYLDFRNTSAYTSTYLYAPEDVDVLFYISADDSPLVFLNGQSVLSEGFEKYNLHLHKGWNTLSIRVYNEWGSWSLTVKSGYDESVNGVKSCTYLPIY